MKLRHALVVVALLGALGAAACCAPETCDDLEEWATEMSAWSDSVRTNVMSLREEVEALRVACDSMCVLNKIPEADCPCQDPSVPPPPGPPPEYPR